jgi:hypothetical protein
MQAIRSAAVVARKHLGTRRLLGTDGWQGMSKNFIDL